MLRLWKVLSLLVFQVCPLTRTILNPTSIGTHAKKCLLLLCTFGYFVTDIFSRIHLNSTSSCVTTWPRVEVKVPIPILILGLFAGQVGGLRSFVIILEEKNHRETGSFELICTLVCLDEWKWRPSSSRRFRVSPTPLPNLISLLYLYCACAMPAG